ncbi:hypothetical protein SAMD00019534_068140 [Acytostelium subglobosum LB1]|uniref:hypothetical protein n=1 Tax=Acytostelium subglobosum LB1 TaxID=1410327 RepID=UPI000644B287|nr:hypothetical protein SAMD00019534_068140 [Acytostelium subglobosum LB1]GAM23639.1 hypothetical protein SAMD00019534_068140 [Acytostelium subglobosum LB1]|eukprot:XP_012753380.1 hypothetical protein SAMD00019534_068140 [Acytostelium subglobosum LB1]
MSDLEKAKKIVCGSHYYIALDFLTKVLRLLDYPNDVSNILQLELIGMTIEQYIHAALAIKPTRKYHGEKSISSLLLTCTFKLLLLEVVTILMANRDLPFRGRDTELQNFIYLVSRRLDKRDSQDRTDHPLTVIASAPGIGKTRLLEETSIVLANHDILQEYYVVQINITFGNGTRTTLKDAMHGGVHALASRILFRFFDPHTTYDIFVHQFESHYGVGSFANISVAVCFNIIELYIRHSHQFQALAKDKRIFFNIGIDEFSLLLLKESILEERYKQQIDGYFNQHQRHYGQLKDQESNRINRSFLKEVILAIVPLLTSNSNSAFFHVTMVGTIITPLKDIIHVDSAHPYKRNPIGLLLFDDTLWINHQYLGVVHLTDIQDAKLRKVLAFIGGWARPLFKFIEAYRSDPANRDSTLVGLLSLVPTPGLESLLPADTMAKLVSMSLTAKQTTKQDWRTPHLVSEESLESLESKGTICSRVMPNGHRVVTLPLILLRKYSDSNALLVPVKLMVDHLIVCDDPNSWEEFCCRYLLARRSSFSILGKTSLSLLEYFGDASHTKMVNQEATFLIGTNALPSFSKFKQQYPKKYESTESVYRNAAGAPFDWVQHFKMPNNYMIYFLCDGKHTIANASLHLAEVNDNITACTAAKTAVLCKNDTYIHCFITNRDTISNDIFTDSRISQLPVLCIDKRSNFYPSSIRSYIDSQL